MEHKATIPANVHPRSTSPIPETPRNGHARSTSQIPETPRNVSSRLRRRSASPPSSVLASDHFSASGEGLDVERLPTDKYEVVVSKVEKQIDNIIHQAIILQKNELIIDKLIFYESIVYLVSSSISNTIGASSIDEFARIVIMYIFLGMNILFSCFGLYIKWLKSKHIKDINSYRDVLKELIIRYEQDAWLAIENSRMELPPEVLAHGFFRGINKN